MLETESLAKAKAGSMDCFVYDPTNPPPPKKVVPPSEPSAAAPAAFGVEVFAGKLFSGTSLEDANGVKALLSGSAQPQSSCRTVSPIEYLLLLKKDIQQLEKDANNVVQPADSLRKLGSLEQVLDPVLADERSAPFLPHVSPALTDPDPVESVVFRVRGSEGAAFQGVGKHQRLQPVLLEQQVGALEKFVGSANPNAPLRKQLVGLQRDVGVLDPAFLASCSRRINSLRAEAVLLDQQKRAVDVALPTEIQTRIDALNALNAKHHKAIQEVVHSVELHAPSSSQDRAANVMQRLHALAQQQKMASDLLNADAASLKGVSETMGTNLKLMKSNIALLEQRLQAIPR